MFSTKELVQVGIKQLNEVIEEFSKLDEQIQDENLKQAIEQIIARARTDKKVFEEALKRFP